jgi:hypothetical protein
MRKPKTQSALDINFSTSACKPEEVNGIIADIRICCETEEELLTHLSVVRNEVKRVLKYENEVHRKVDFIDENCYGSHSVEIDLFKL